MLFGENDGLESPFTSRYSGLFLGNLVWSCGEVSGET